MAKITKREKDYSQWYLDIIREAKLADYAPVKGCMVIRPDGYAIWEHMQAELDRMFKDTGHVNAYFPIFIPKSFMSREAEHVEGFAKECAVVTHYRLKQADDGSGLIADPAAKLDEELIVRPTSETIIWSMYKNWIQSYRDLPILINQWANVVRWEMRTRLFLRTAEFLWQEGHTAHSTYEEAEEETVRMLNVYKTFAEDYMAMPAFSGKKTHVEKFAGALHTYAIESMMQDKKALQAGTSHNLGQNFATAFDVRFQDKDGELKHVWATSWGVSTRLIGALIMCHSDDDGLVLPPRLAPKQVVIVPIWKNDDEKASVLEVSGGIQKALKAAGVRVHVDDRDQYKPGWKFNEWELKGIPVRIEIGPKDVAREQVVVARRDTREKQTVQQDSAVSRIEELLDLIQKGLFERAKAFRDENTHEVGDYQSMEEVIKGDRGFVKAFWDGADEDEEKLKELKASVRCIISEDEEGKGIVHGNPTKQQVLIAKAY